MKAPKPKLFHLLSLSLILGSPLSGAGLPDAQVRYDDVKEMKSANPNFTDWLPVKFEDREFIFCQNIHPAFGVSIIDLYGWQYNQTEKKWELLIHAATKGVGKAIISFNQKTGTISMKGDANNRFKEAVVASMDLRATVL